MDTRSSQGQVESLGFRAPRDLRDHACARTHPKGPTARPAVAARAVRLVRLSALSLVFAGSGYGLGAYSYARGLWPVDVIREILAPNLVGRQDPLGRQITFPGKSTVPCPVQSSRTAVLLAIGQSNIGNHGAAFFTSRHPAKVVNYFDGQCFPAASPLLGATGQGGEYLTPLGDQLVESGRFDSVVLIARAVGASNIQRWKAGGDVLDALLSELPEIQQHFRINGVLWQQGESDVPLRTSAPNYVESFVSMLTALRRAGVRAPVFIAISSRCGLEDGWVSGNPVANAQRQLVDGKAIFLGFDSDSLLRVEDRRADACHLSSSGQLRTAIGFAAAVVRHRQAVRSAGSSS